jgi:hypothetical protein
MIETLFVFLLFGILFGLHVVILLWSLYQAYRAIKEFIPWFIDWWNGDLTQSDYDKVVEDDILEV